MSGAETSAGRRYLAIANELVARLAGEEWPRIAAAAGLLTDAIAAGRTVHAFGSGHSHMLAEELFYRAGGLVRVRPILFEGLMLHGSPTLGTTLERMPGLAAALFADHPMDAGDVLIVASNSGSNAVSTELATLARDHGVRTIGITSLRHATSASARVSDGPRLHELVDVAIDNGGAVGDAAVAIEGLTTRVGPTSTVVGAAILDALVAEVVERLVARGIAPEVYASSNVAGGDAVNDRYRDTTAIGR
ncbi:MAG: SIS domain-containing protein [Candidatus Limnocylindrales bacterium]